jgi:hypothetical protein
MKADKKLTSEKESKIYTCPMHPEVKSEVAGKYPKWGMILLNPKNKV